MQAVPCRTDRITGASPGAGFRLPPWLGGWLVVCSLLAGCGEPSSNAPDDDGGAATTEVERGPLKVRVEVEPEPAQLSDIAKLTVTYDFEPGVQLEKPPFGEMFGEFLILGFSEPPTEFRDGREVQRQVYDLEPLRSGALGIDPLVVFFTDARQNGDGERHRVETEALTLNVSSVVEADVPSLDDLEDFEDPVELPRGWSAWYWIVSAAGLCLVCVGVACWLLSQRIKQEQATERTPREIALEELEQLREEALSRTDVKEFYVRLSGIVRRFIENASGVRAPEQTTEEFLREISGTAELFDDLAQQRLKRFLESADLVKFAAFQPAENDVADAYRRAERFVDAQGPKEAE